MASIFKNFLNNDIVSTRTLLHEAIPITGSIVSGTYADQNIKYYSHGLFESVYDFPYLSSSANHIFDITTGYSPNSALSSSANNQNQSKINIYQQMAQVLLGHDTTGSILEFDQNGNVTATGTKLREVIFLNFARLLTKDEIQKGSFQIQLGEIPQFSSSQPFTSLLTITDAGAQNNFRVNSPVGEFSILSASVGGAFSGSFASGAVGNPGLCGLIFYQAGVVVLSASVFMGSGSGGLLQQNANMNSNGDSYQAMLTGSSITSSADAFRHRLFNLFFNNTTELNSTIHFCRINNNDFNYSSNPTYVSGSRINVKNSTLDAPVSYVTAVGLYSADNELLAVAKLSEPLKKDPTNELNLRVRLDY